MTKMQMIMRAVIAGGVAFLVASLLFGMGDVGTSPGVIGGAVGGAVGATIQMSRAKPKQVVLEESQQGR